VVSMPAGVHLPGGSPDTPAGVNLDGHHIERVKDEKKTLVIKNTTDSDDPILRSESDRRGAQVPPETGAHGETRRQPNGLPVLSACQSC